MSFILEKPNALVPSRFAYLMALYAENYQRLARLFAPHRLREGSYRSCINDHLDIRLDVIEKHRYTLDLRLTYCIVDNATGELAPSAYLRVYSDAHATEAMHCTPGKELWQVLGPFPAVHTIFEHRMRMNSFLSRWLEYLAEQGHSLETLETLRE